MHEVFNDIWKICPKNTLKNRSWHWWWWIHFFENPDNPELPRQLMVLWGTRNCKKVRVNDLYWEPNISIEINENHTAFQSIVASWYYDGKRMHDPFILDHGKTETEWDDHSGRISMKSDQGAYSFGGSPALRYSSRCYDSSYLTITLPSASRYNFTLLIFGERDCKIATCSGNNSSTEIG